jgi:hypothetical protein
MAKFNYQRKRKVFNEHYFLEYLHICKNKNFKISATDLFGAKLSNKNCATFIIK